MMSRASGRRTGSTFTSRVLGPLVIVAALVLLTDQVAGAAESRLVSAAPRPHGAIALTFDDGWGEANCERITQALRAHGVTATFFINGVHLKAQPRFWRRILRDMPVGNHTVSHLDLVAQTADEVRHQLRKNEAIHEDVLERPMVKVFRPPYGSSDARVRRIAGSLGYQWTVLWSRSAADTSPAATVTSIIRHTTGAPAGAIILMHCGPDATADALPTIIRHYKARRIRMVGLDELLGMTSADPGDERPVPPKPPDDSADPPGPFRTTGGRIAESSGAIAGPTMPSARSDSHDPWPQP
jgi:peptidoglycan/xylan/chitin deacetylase (PgdA/CDA1 family)